MYVVDYGEVCTDFTMPSPCYTVANSGVIWTITYTGDSQGADVRPTGEVEQGASEAQTEERPTTGEDTGG